jgi:hypothetical protein
LQKPLPLQSEFWVQGGATLGFAQYILEDVSSLPTHAKPDGHALSPAWPHPCRQLGKPPTTTHA